MRNDFEKLGLPDDEENKVIKIRSGRTDEEIKRLLGFRNFPKRTNEEKKRLLGSEARLKALDAITTTTHPISKKEMKKGVVLEVIEKDLISKEVWRQQPLIYLGSGIDIEYALALGARNIKMVDSIFSDEKATAELIKNIEKLIVGKVKKAGDKLLFVFDFGNGQEQVSVELINKRYPLKKREADDYVLPDEVGAIVLYASQGPEGSIRADEEMKSKLVEGGIILEETRVIKKKGDEYITNELGA